ncbi:hypothetical protein L4G92_00185 [Neisseria sp. ZJ106]|uniref:Uncharacterized protein n=1 Tax=Neisseria lisongii TaxID=2912188 RepID=A0ABY7RK39_9NEIS|nr:hypothetical protein [Neisseria lisongii]MCF7520475.1 hypothetical protein [Neisseria lisongii]WCL71583.1 hypothetical protein PJU73_00175 [Neisseria lisongii]
MKGLLEYERVLIDLEVEPRILGSYLNIIEIFKKIKVTADEIKELEYRVLLDCLEYYRAACTLGYEYREKYYKELGLIIDTDDSGVNIVSDSLRKNLWEGVEYGSIYYLKKLEADESVFQGLYYFCAAAMVIIGYAESILSGAVSRNSINEMFDVLRDTSYLLARAANILGNYSVFSIGKKIEKSEQSKKARQSGISKAFKTEFKENIAKPLIRQHLNNSPNGLFKRGEKTALIKRIQDSYDGKVLVAKREKRRVSVPNQSLSERTIKKWIDELIQEHRSKIK